MNLYLISQYVNEDLLSYDSAVVCAETESDARMIHPCYTEWDGEDEKEHSSWCAVKDVEVEFIGIAGDGIPRGVICASYGAF